MPAISQGQKRRTLFSLSQVHLHRAMQSFDYVLDMWLASKTGLVGAKDDWGLPLSSGIPSSSRTAGPSCGWPPGDWLEQLLSRGLWKGGKQNSSPKMTGCFLCD